VKAAQQVHGIGKVASGMTARRFEQRVEIRMTRAAFARYPSELCFGNTDRLAFYGPVDRHSFPLVRWCSVAL
jgi:hypothetical protein